MRTIRFTKAVHQELPVPDAGKRLEYADSVVNELRLRVTSSGSKSFCVSRKRDVKFYRVTLGKFLDMTIEQARERAYGLVARSGVKKKAVKPRLIYGHVFCVLSIAMHMIATVIKMAGDCYRIRPQPF